MMPSVDVERPSLRGFAGMLRRTLLAGALLVAASAWAGPSVTYDLKNVDDVTPGVDLWRYNYTVNGPLDLGGRVTLVFSYLLYSDLVSSSVDPNVGFAPDTQPDSFLGVDGLVEMTSFIGLLASETHIWSVDFVWLGAGTPGSQLFQIYDGGQDFVSEAQTAASGVVPEPAAASLVGAGLLALALTRRHAKKS
jgi:hypothetical protein